jgi:hypothetical protein
VHDVIIKTLAMAALAIAVSMIIATLIKFIVVALDWFENRRTTTTQPETAATPSVVPALDVNADHIAAIAAAVYTSIGAHRIIHIEDVHRGEEWVVGGRLAHHTSHTISHHPRH